jgi:hypothetical protein
MYYTLVAPLVEIQLFFAPAIFEVPFVAHMQTAAAYLPALQQL